MLPLAKIKLEVRHITRVRYWIFR